MLADMTTIKTDDRRCDLIMPKKIVYASEGVERAEWVLENTDTQAYAWGDNYTTLSTQEGKRAVILLDFGTELYGGLQVITQKQGIMAGVSATVRFGESANEAMTPTGIKGACCDHGMRDFDVKLSPNGCNRIGQTGFRFASVELTEPDTFVKLYALQGVSIYRDIRYRGSFRCSDGLLNRIYDTCAYTAHLCMQNLLWDGIKRDRLVWIGDMHPEILTIRTVFGAHPIVDDSLRYVAKNSPLPGWPNGIASYGMWYLLVLKDWYWYSGNADLVWELSGYWKPLLIQLLALVHEESGEVLIEEELQSGYFLDWPTRDHSEAKAGIYGLFAQALCAAGKLCSITGDPVLAETCIHKASVLTGVAFKPGVKKQVTAMLQLAGMCNGKEAGKALTEGGGRGMSTFQSYYILKATAQTADVSVALDMLREYYGAMLLAGATTFWEDFDLDWMREGANIETLAKDGAYDIHGDNGRYCYRGFRHSLCHGWSSAPAAFLAEEILGCHIEEAGCKCLKVKPHLGNLLWAEGTYPTPYGEVSVSARKEGSKTTISVNAPDEIRIV